MVATTAIAWVVFPSYSATYFFHRLLGGLRAAPLLAQRALDLVELEPLHALLPPAVLRHRAGARRRPRAVRGRDRPRHLRRVAPARARDGRSPRSCASRSAPRSARRSRGTTTSSGSCSSRSCSSSAAALPWWRTGSLGLFVLTCLVPLRLARNEDLSHTAYDWIFVVIFTARNALAAASLLWLVVAAIPWHVRATAQPSAATTASHQARTAG